MIGWVGHTIDSDRVVICFRRWLTEISGNFKFSIFSELFIGDHTPIPAGKNPGVMISREMVEHRSKAKAENGVDLVAVHKVCQIKVVPPLISGNQFLSRLAALATGAIQRYVYIVSEKYLIPEQNFSFGSLSVNTEGLGGIKSLLFPL